MQDWRKAGQDTIIAELDNKKLSGFSKSAIVQENLEAIVVLKNGLVDEICTAGSIQTLCQAPCYELCEANQSVCPLHMPTVREREKFAVSFHPSMPITSTLIMNFLLSLT